VRNRDGVLWTDNGQNLAADFTPSGVRVHRGNKLWGMRMIAYGYGNDLRAVMIEPDYCFSAVTSFSRTNI
jgi:hypothetical protein